jgi:F-type H+-transporting ATPase subunit b
MPTQNLDIISVNLWQMVVSLANLVLLFLIVKKFLYKPVKKMLESRQSAIEKDYADAREAKEQALADRDKYQEQLCSAKGEADLIIQNAVTLAEDREQEILDNAKRRADGIVLQAQQEAEQERRRADHEIKEQIVEVSSLLTEKLLERELSEDDHRHFINEFIESIGDGNEAT